jgi:murein DD-endopeptidase MepM/ murein hydrolase activator NlpD
MKKILLLSSCFVTISCATQAPVGYQAYGVEKGAGSTGMHTILPGDTVYKIAQNYQLPMREIITLNNIEAPYVLNTGYRLRLPPPNEYNVRAGDSIFDIAKMHEVSVNRLVELNKLKPPYKLPPGQTLRLPAPTAPMKTEVAARATERIDTQAVRPEIQSGRVAASPAPVESEVLAPTTVATRTSAAEPVYPPQPQANAYNPNIQPASAASRPVPDIPDSTGDGEFMQPVSGTIISTFGPKADGLHNDGINIKAVRGAPVRAAESGTIVYVGDDLKGYGNLVLIRHKNKMMTAYAHLEKSLVEKGDSVQRGQAIGTVGSSGQVDSPQLHFEIRQGTTALDPAKYI